MRSSSRAASRPVIRYLWSGETSNRAAAFRTAAYSRAGVGRRRSPSGSRPSAARSGRARAARCGHGRGGLEHGAAQCREGAAGRQRARGRPYPERRPDSNRDFAPGLEGTRTLRISSERTIHTPLCRPLLSGLPAEGHPSWICDLASFPSFSSLRPWPDRHTRLTPWRDSGTRSCSRPSATTWRGQRCRRGTCSISPSPPTMRGPPTIRSRRRGCSARPWRGTRCRSPVCRRRRTCRPLATRRSATPRTGCWCTGTRSRPATWRRSRASTR